MQNQSLVYNLTEVPHLELLLRQVSAGQNNQHIRPAFHEMLSKLYRQWQLIENYSENYLIMKYNYHLPKNYYQNKRLILSSIFISTLLYQSQSNPII